MLAADLGVATVEFAGQTLTPMTEGELISASSSYEGGFICDGCEGSFAPGGGWTVFHGDGLPEAALDLCSVCAEDSSSAERRLEEQRVRAAAEERRQQQLELRENMERIRRIRQQRGGGSRGAAMMLYEHSGRVGFDNAKANLAVPTPPKDQVCAMLERETQLRNAPVTQRLLDHLGDDTTEGEAHDVESLEEAQRVIEALRAELKSLKRKKEDEGEEGPQLHSIVTNATCDKEVFEGIKAQVVAEFNLDPQYVDVLNTAASRFPGDKDIVESANYLKFNRAHQGDIAVGDTVPLDALTLASLGGGGALCSLRQHITPTRADDHRPVAIVAGSIT